MKENEVGGACGMHGRGEKRVRGFGGEPEGERLLGRPRRRLEDGTKTDIIEIGLGGVEWIHLATYIDRRWAVFNAVMNSRFVAPEN
jgi:hypothetical protein